MVNDPVTGSLVPVDFEHISDQVPELKKFGYNIRSVSFNPVSDSSNIDPEIWIKMASVIEDHFEDYDGFVVLHGTDTMAYSASALSFMLENLKKPVIFTGSQLPIGVLRTDGKENLITAIEIAASQDYGRPRYPRFASTSTINLCGAIVPLRSAPSILMHSIHQTILLLLKPGCI